MYKTVSSIALIVMPCIMHSQKVNHQINKQIKMSNASTLHEANEMAGVKAFVIEKDGLTNGTSD